MESSRQAIVIGGSMAGLWTARVLADHFAQVTIVERDLLPLGPQSRTGVPQDKHVHILLARGSEIMQQLFPGVVEELLAAGAIHVNLSRDSRTKMRGQWLQRFTGRNETYACSRILLEATLRQRVRALPQVQFCEGAQVVGLLAEGDRVTGVRVHQSGQANAAELSADFVVDASGRTSKTPTWLTELGYGAPEETVINAHVGYAGRRYRKPAGIAEDWHIMLVGAQPPTQSRQGLIYEEEHGVWMVMLAGIMQDYPPTQEAEFLTFAQSVEPALYEAIRQAEPLTEIFGYRHTENRFRHYEKLARWPERFVVTGDAACAFNPIYGQGMTTAAVMALALGDLLRQSQGLDGVARRFQQQIPKIVEPAWLLATGADIEWIGRPARQPLTSRVSQWYLSQLLDTMPVDREVHEAFSAVQHLMQPPVTLFRPPIARRVLAHWWRARRQRRNLAVQQRGATVLREVESK
ncbi:MAG: FAD-dependent monooxygenase [Caldilineaceae bacterium]